MKIINIIENTQGNNTIGYFEHGLSVYVQTKYHTLLIDTGSNANTWENAKLLNVDLDSIEMIFLSHGHYDHSGGLLSFPNPKVDIYMHQKAGLDYYSFTNGKEKYIGIDKKILDLPSVHFLNKNTIIDKDISIYCDVTSKKLWPQSNLRLKKLVKGEYIQDEFDHEMYIVIEEDNRYYLFSGCAHNGIINIMDRFKEIYGRNPDVVISGFHMARKTELSKQDKEIIVDIANELKKTNTVFYTGHCTGIEAFDLMKSILKDQLIYMHSMDQIEG